MLINGNSAIRFREYEAACDRLKAIWEQLASDEGRALVLDRLSISTTRYSGDARGLEAVGAAIAKAMKADAPQYLAGLIEKAQADVHDASRALHDALADDLLAKQMKKAKGK